MALTVMRCKTRGCGNEFVQHNSLQSRCYTCMANIARKRREKADREDRKRDNARNRADKERIKTKPQLTREAQDATNLLVRLRDHDKPCISCGRYDHEIKERLRGGKWDAGHYLSVGAKPELRFELLNIHRQCKSCNGGSGKYARKNETVRTEYRKRLIDRIGLENVEWLEGPHVIPNYTHDDLRAIRDERRKMARELKKSINDGAC